MATFSGIIKLSGYNVQNTLSGTCNGGISNIIVSGGSAPYTVTWTGNTTTYTADTFNLNSLCAADYEATITDINGNTAKTTLTVSALTIPSLTVSITNSACTTDTNKVGQITVDSSTTTTNNYRYEIRKSGKLISTYYGNTGSTSHVFNDLKNGEYTIKVVEQTPATISTIADNSGCTAYDYLDDGKYSGWTISTLFAKWTNYVPFAPFRLNFTSGWGPGYGSDFSFPLGLGPNGKVYTKDPSVWLYTGITSNRLTDSSSTWYLGTSAFTMNEGGAVGPAIGSTNADIGKFYFNTYINKFILRWPTLNSGVGWVTIDPRVNYGRYGNPIASLCTGSTYGVLTSNVGASDYTINSSGNVDLASDVLAGTNNRFSTSVSSNNSQFTGMLSLCSYNNYTWQTSFNSTAVTSNDVALVLAAFRDDTGKYGVKGVTHNLTLVFNSSSGSVSIKNNFGNEAYAISKTKIPLFHDCRFSGCSDTNPYYGVSTILTNTGTQSPYSGSTIWNDQGSTRVKVTRSGEIGEKFNIQITDTMGATASGAITKGDGAANPYNSLYTINLNLLDKTTWTGNSESIGTWVDNYALCKYLGSRKIGFGEYLQASSRWYHMSFSGSPSEEVVVAPLCSQLDGPSVITGITLTTGTTSNIIESSTCNSYFSCSSGVPKVKPRLTVSIQNMPEPSVTVTNLNKVTTNVSTTIGFKPSLDIYNSVEDKTKKIQFYFGGQNEDMVFGNMFPKFRIFPYIFQTEEVSTLPDYEAIFDTQPRILDNSTNDTLFSASTYIPLSALSTEVAWEFVVRLSYLYKDKKYKNNEVWVDTASYPTKKYIDYNTDQYMVVVSNPPIPTLKLTDFIVRDTKPSIKIETTRVTNIPDASSPLYSAYTYYYTLSTENTSKPFVVANGLVLKEGLSASTDSTTEAMGDYQYMRTSRAVRFHPETVQNNDELQFLYDAVGGSYTQFVTVPSTVTSTVTEEIYEQNGYYYINLDKQSSGGVGVAVNGATLFNDKDYRKSGEKQIQLLRPTSTYVSGDTIALFYRTIYSVIGFSATKEPVIPIKYVKDKPLKEEIMLNMFNYNGDLISEQQKTLGINVVGSTIENFKLIPPAPGRYTYKVIIKRYYPLISGEEVVTESQTELVPFEITRDVFYSPS